MTTIFESLEILQRVNKNLIVIRKSFYLRWTLDLKHFCEIIRLLLPNWLHLERDRTQDLCCAGAGWESSSNSKALASRVFHHINTY